MEQDIISFLNVAILAPSGDNVQPWRVALRPNGIDLFNVPERDSSLYNWQNRAAYISHGAFLENFSLAAQQKRYKAMVTLFPEGASSDHVATVELVPGGEPDVLIEAVFRRATNRKAYEKKPLTETERRELLEKATVPSTKATIRFYDAPEQLEILGAALGRNEEVLFGNKAMHDFFFDHINWSKAENDTKRTGFTLETLELPPPARVLFPLWKHWSIMSFFAFIGFPKVIAKGNGKLYSSAAGFGAVIITDNTPEAYVEVGRAFERLWLSATRLGLNMQTLAGIPLLHERIELGLGDPFTTQQKGVIQAAYQDIITAMSTTKGEIVAVCCRIGKGPLPSGRTARRTVEEILKV